MVSRASSPPIFMSILKPTFLWSRLPSSTRPSRSEIARARRAPEKQYRLQHGEEIQSVVKYENIDNIFYPRFRTKM
jgi:hypothetical protein